jgi:hypothetical protein
LSELNDDFVSLRIITKEKFIVKNPKIIKRE